MKRRIIIAVAAVFLMGFAASSMLRGNSEYYEKYEEYKYGFIPYYSSIENKASDRDIETAENIITLAREIMTDTESTTYPDAGKLESYSVKYSLTEKEIAVIEAELNLITADFTFNSGYMWVEYSKVTYDKYEEKIDEGQYLAYWKLRKENGIWRVTRIKEEAVSTVS